jgi:hypothetical protein
MCAVGFFVTAAGPEGEPEFRSLVCLGLVGGERRSLDYRFWSAYQPSMWIAIRSCAYIEAREEMRTVSR